MSPAIAHRSATPELARLIAQEPDFVDRIFEYLLREIPQLAGPHLDEAKQAVREEFGGQEVYIGKLSAIEREELAGKVLSKFNGRNATEVARELRISRASVYRYLKQAGGRRKASQSSGK